MAYPWPGFGTFQFTRAERPLDGLGGGWNYTPAEARSRALGAYSDSVVLLNVGSGTRQFDCYLSPARFNQLRALLWTVDTFTDWDRPVPDSRPARLDEVTYNSSVAFTDPDCAGPTDRRVLVTVRFSSQ